MNNFRYELGIHFVEQISDLKGPPEVIAGVGGYVQDPAVWKDSTPWMGLSSFNSREPRHTWQEIWERLLWKLITITILLSSVEDRSQLISPLQ